MHTREGNVTAAVEGTVMRPQAKVCRHRDLDKKQRHRCSLRASWGHTAQPTPCFGPRDIDL